MVRDAKYRERNFLNPILGLSATLLFLMEHGVFKTGYWDYAIALAIIIVSYDIEKSGERIHSELLWLVLFVIIYFKPDNYIVFGPWIAGNSLAKSEWFTKKMEMVSRFRQRFLYHYNKAE